MTIFELGHTLRSDKTPEWAQRKSTGWQLSWLPDRILTRRQAMAGMRLDEIVSDPACLDDHIAHARATQYAGELDMVLDQAIIRLYKRMIARLADSEQDTRAAAPPALTLSTN